MIFYVRYVYVTNFSHFFNLLFYCNLDDLLIFLSCNIK